MVYLGKYKGKELHAERLNTLYSLMGKGPPTSVKPGEIETVADKLEAMLQKIQDLNRSAKNYSNTHIDQNFRVMNAALLEIQVNLDKVDVTGDDHARQLRKKGLITSEEAADTLMAHIHNNYKDCPKCLKL